MSVAEVIETSGYERLARPVQKWIHLQGWQRLREIQEMGIDAILTGDEASGDVIIAAATASGKTEAAFLPLISRIIDGKNSQPGFSAIYISPLKALINDQHRRLSALCEAVDMPVHKWHGDVPQSAKTRARKNPDGILLITPESLEALLMRRGNEVDPLVKALSGVVIDELHAFIGSERGVQLQSILHRIDTISGRKIDRIGLSATLGDMKLAADALRPGYGSEVAILESKEERGALQTQLRSYVDIPDDDRQEADAPKSKKKRKKDKDNFAGSAGREIAEHIFATMSGKPNLIFAGSRSVVELLADNLRETSARAGTMNEFFAHHGNLSKEHREFVEGRLREDKRPTTAIATSTLELGIDLGDVDAVGQIGAPYTVASLRQRVGRSGRREGQAAVLRMYCAETTLEPGAQLPFRLRFGLVHAIATLNLLLKGWCEPPAEQGLHFSTLVHQVLATITQYGGLEARRLYQLLCISGPFHSVEPELFGALLRGMGEGEKPLVEQAEDGSLLLGRMGERLTSHFSFYAVFQTPDEYKVIAAGKQLGKIEVKGIPKIGESMIFSGRRWLVVTIDEDSKSVHLIPSSNGKAKFGGAGCADIHDEIIQEMHRIYQAKDLPNYLDETTKELLREARKNYTEVTLNECPVQRDSDGVLLFANVGSIKQTALKLALEQKDLKVSMDCNPYYISISKCAPADVLAALQKIAEASPPDPILLADYLPERNLYREKYDRYVPVELLRQAFAHERIDAVMIPKLAQELINF